MKRFLFIISLITIANTSIGQVWCNGWATPIDWNFDGGQPPSPYEYILDIDTLTNPNNIWQIGIPQKGIINNAYSSPNVIITDTINPYPSNDTSEFIFIHIDHGGYSMPHSAEIAGYYNVNSDSLNDYGTIEISLNQGTSWINLITDTVYSSYYYWLTPKPTLTGNSNGWQNFVVSLADLGFIFNVNLEDTILLKFSFISDSNADTLDGLAYDNFQFCDGAEGIEEIFIKNLISVYPNPTNNYITIENPLNERLLIEIYNSKGQRIKTIEQTEITSTINISDIHHGLYLIRIISKGNRNKIVKLIKK